MKDWAERQADKLGITPAEVLRRLFADSGNKYSAAASLAGVTPQALMKLAKRYAVEKQDARAFEYLGVTARMVDHCQRLGINRKSAEGWRARNHASGAQTLDHYRLGRQRKRAWKTEG